MIELRDALNIHDILIEKFGGSKGVRDQGSLESALHRPFATFDNQELYPFPSDKAAAILESILINHPFIDGNKRTAYVLMRIVLLEGGFDLNADQDDKYQMVIAASTGEIRFEEIKHWIQTRIVEKNESQP
jgi:death-on-curing protein